MSIFTHITLTWTTRELISLTPEMQVDPCTGIANNLFCTSERDLTGNFLTTKSNPRRVVCTVLVSIWSNIILVPCSMNTRLNTKFFHWKLMSILSISVPSTSTYNSKHPSSSKYKFQSSSDLSRCGRHRIPMVFGHVIHNPNNEANPR